jgi:lysophospholipase L1-like esterase
MSLRLLVIFTTLLITSCFSSSAQTTIAKSETQDRDNRELPKVLIIGDSISIGYTKPVMVILKGKIKVIHNKGNAQHSKNGLAKLEGWLGKTKWDVIHFNHGLHDLKYLKKNGKSSNTKTNAHMQIPLEEYRKNMEAIVVRLKKTGAKLIFATTTPYPKGVKPLRVPEDASKYNEVAIKIMKEHKVKINDLYSFALPQLKKLQRPANVHFTKKGSKALGEEVAKYILEALSQR